MRILLNIYHHYVEVVLPMLAQQYNWSIQFDTQFKQLVRDHFGFYFRMNRKQLKQAIAFCRELSTTPENAEMQFKCIKV